MPITADEIAEHANLNGCDVEIIRTGQIGRCEAYRTLTGFHARRVHLDDGTVVDCLLAHQVTL